MRIYRISAFSSLHRKTRLPLAKYVVQWIKNPDPGSAFEKTTRQIRWLPGWILIRLLLSQGYDGSLYVDDDERSVVSHVFFQRHEDEMRIFSVSVREEYRGRGIALETLLLFLTEVRNRSEVCRVRMGAGGHPGIVRIWQKIAKGEIILPFKVSAGEQIGVLNFV